MSEPSNLLVFISHVSEDKTRVRKLCQRLKADGFDPWLDEERILPGQDWDMEIRKAMRLSQAILLCFSHLSMAKEGYVQREYKKALDYQQEKPEGTIFVIPLRLDDCEVPFSIRELQYVDYPAGYERLVLALNARAGKTNISSNVPKAKKQAKQPEPKKATRSRGNGGSTYNIGTINVGRDLIQGDQVNFITETPAQFVNVLTGLQVQIDALKNQPGLADAQVKGISTVADRLAEVATEVRKEKPAGEQIKKTLDEAREQMDRLKNSLQSAAALGTTLGGLAALAIKLFGR